MATDIHPARSGGPGDGTDERWQRMWSHREQLLKVARRRSMSAEDAEDAVHEAMIRAAESPHLDEERLGAWLTTVTMRLCVDRYRQVNREAEVCSRSVVATPGPVPVEEQVCDRAEAKWLAGRSGELPARQAEALRLKSEDLDVGQVAQEMGLSYEAVESLLARARRTLRNSLAGTLALAVWVWGRRPRTPGTAPAVAAASMAATLAVLSLAVPYSDQPHTSHPPRPAPSRTAGSFMTDRGRTTPPARSGPAAAQDSGGTGKARPADAPAGAASVVPEVLLPVLPSASVPSIPSIPSVPQVPPVPSLPPLPSVGSVPRVVSSVRAPAQPSL